MSIEHPETLEEWKQFRFPTRDCSTLVQARRAIALANGEGVEEEEGGDGDSEGGRGGSAGPAMLEGLIGQAVASEAAAPLPIPIDPPALMAAPSAADATGDSWSYDAARGLLINWRIGKTLILAKMDKVGKLLEYAKLVESSKIDRPGFESSLDQACQDIHGQSLSTILKNWDPKSPLAWGEMPEKAILPPSRPRRRTSAH